MGGADVLTGLTKHQVLAEIEDVIRAMPDTDKLHWDSLDVLAWLGRATAVIENWSMAKSVAWTMAVNDLRRGGISADGRARVIMLLHQAHNDLRMKTIGPANLAIGQGHVFDYMDAMRKIISLAKTDILFVDRYLNGSFASQFLPLVSDGVSIRLLTRRDAKTEKALLSLIPLATAFKTQHGVSIEIRSHNDHHQRYIFLDKSSAYESGSSFKDGPTTAGSTIIQQTGDVLSQLISTHESLWQTANIELQ
ncbi:hypothetical protein [Hyphomicrobium sp.]|uniref:hypothetical protein n=1 Tax=Hyphomicrobium sp. TaxID=82 RepID=UPI000FC0B2C1|nr:hypothetical protein [Hyphomicrobium sp.]RUP10185.1 MAG: hypothetical protein EKK38_07070 [Hyphomicrobium sp.]